MLKSRQACNIQKLAPGAWRCLGMLVCAVCLSRQGVAKEDGSTNDQKDPSAASSKPAELAPLDAAKRKFQDSQQQEKTTPDQSSKIEPFVTPSLQLPGQDPLTLFLNQRRELEKKRPHAKDNWLVDGVLGNSTKEKDGTAKTSGRGLQASQTKEDEEKGTEKDQSSLEAELREPKSETDSKGTSSAPTASKVDPLLPFMEKWMSAKDFDLLIRPSAGSSSGQSPSSLASNGPALEQSPGSGVQTELARRFESSRAAVNQAENPFLKAMESWKATPPVQVPGSASSTGQLSDDSKLVTPDRKVLERTASKEPAAPFKPADDRKYFPQLKRF